MSLSVLGPQGLRVVRVTDVSLLVEWESVRGAEYYILTYHPKDDEGALEQVGFLFFSVLTPSSFMSDEREQCFFKPSLCLDLPHLRFRFPTQRTPTSSQACLLGSPTSSRCTLSSKRSKARQTRLKPLQVSTDCHEQPWGCEVFTLFRIFKIRFWWSEMGLGAACCL